MAIIARALSRHFVTDEEVAKRILREILARCADASIAEIVAVIDLKVPSVLQNHSIRNPLGLVIKAISQLFEGAAIVQLRAEWAAEKAREEAQKELRELERQEMNAWVLQQCSKCEGILSNSASAEKDKVSAQRELAQLRPMLERATVQPHSDEGEKS